MHEIVTLQFGSRANYLGTHFWNTQESYFTYDPTSDPSPVDHDVSFRPGIGSDGSDTYTPRTLVYDLKSEFGSFKQINTLYDSTTAGGKVGEVKGLWDGVQRLQTVQRPIEPSPYQTALETGLPTPQLRSSDVRYWSDFNRLFYHPRSLISLSSQSLTSQLFASDSFAAGEDLFRDLDLEVGGLLDRDLRLFVEECDSIQGFQIFAGSDDAWGGWASRYVEEMREEFGKKAIWVWGVEEGRREGERMKQFRRLANTSRVLASLSSTASAFVRLATVPSSLPGHVKLETGSLWSTTALLASTVETVTLPTRLRPSSAFGAGARSTSMAQLEEVINSDSGRDVWTLEARINAVDEGTANGNHNSFHNTLAVRDQRVDPQQRYQAQDDDEDSTHMAKEDLGPSGFDIDFTPSIPRPQDSMPSLRSSTKSDPRHIFTQVESHRHPPSSTSQQQKPTSLSLPPSERLHRIYSDDPVVQIYDTPLPFPLLDSFPSDLFASGLISTSTSTPPISSYSHRRTQRRDVSLSAALSTSSHTRTEIRALRDLAVGGQGRQLGLVEVEKREEMYDEFTKLAERYAFGFDDGGEGEEDEED